MSLCDGDAGRDVPTRILKACSGESETISSTNKDVHSKNKIYQMTHMQNHIYTQINQNSVNNVCWMQRQSIKSKMHRQLILRPYLLTYRACWRSLTLLYLFTVHACLRLRILNMNVNGCDVKPNRAFFHIQSYHSITYLMRGSRVQARFFVHIGRRSGVRYDT